MNDPEIIEGPPAAELLAIIEQYRPDIRLHKSVLITIGSTIYNTTGRPLKQHELVHEKEHVRQQEAFDGTFEQYAARFFKDPLFMLLIEAQAYAAEIKDLVPDPEDAIGRRIGVSEVVVKLCKAPYDLRRHLNPALVRTAVEFFLL